MKSNVKKVIISLVAVLLVITIAYKTFATNGNQSILNEIEGMLQNQNANVDAGNTIEQIPEGENGNNNAEANTNANANTNNENAPTTTPYAGVGNYSGLIFVGIFTVSAVYAYKKIKEYNM